MKNNKKIIYIILFISIIAGYLLLGSTVNKYNSFRSFKQYFPQELKDFVKKKFFFYKYQKYLEKELYLSKEHNKNNIYRQEFADSIKEKKIINLIEDYGYINFKKNNEEKTYEIDNREIRIEKFQTNAISVPKYVGKGTAYLEYNNNNLFVISAHGMFFFVDVDEFNNRSFNAKVIKSNIRDKIKYDRFYIKSVYGIKDVLISKNKIFISYVKQQDDTNSQKWRNNCYSISILVADLNYEYLKFKEFFSQKMCIKEEDERYVDFLAHQSGGRIVEFKNNKLLFSIGEFRTYVVSQEKSNLYGKIISLDVEGKNPKIISMGHRNPQGLFYDKKNDIIFSTEHGLDGGDEVNYNTSPGGNKIENFGWPISSYGDHKYDVYDYQLYKLFPLHKSHSKYGFVEPLKYFYPSIGISEIIKLENNSKDADFNVLLVASMGSLLKEGDLSLHYLKADKNFKIIDHKILKVNERIRDIKYVKELNKVFLFYETSAAIGVLTLK